MLKTDVFGSDFLIHIDILGWDRYYAKVVAGYAHAPNIISSSFNKVMVAYARLYRLMMANPC